MKAALLISWLAVLALLILANASHAETCFADAYGVRRHSPDAWPSWTLRMPGHEGEKCWYPTAKDKRHVRFEKTTGTDAAISPPGIIAAFLSAWTSPRALERQTPSQKETTESEVMPNDWNTSRCCGRSTESTHATRPRLARSLAGAANPRCNRDCRAYRFYRDVMEWDREMLLRVWEGER